jgi:hypothetical protein
MQTLIVIAVVLGGDTAVDAFVERAELRGVRRRFLFVLFQDRFISTRQSLQLVDFLDMIVGTMRSDHTCNARMHSRKCLVVSLLLLVVWEQDG